MADRPPSRRTRRGTALRYPTPLRHPKPLRKPTIEDCEEGWVAPIEAFFRANPGMARNAMEHLRQIRDFRLGAQPVQIVSPAPAQNTEPAQPVPDTEPAQNTEPAQDTQSVRRVPVPDTQPVQSAQPVAPTQEQFVKVGLFRMLDGMPEEVVDTLNNTQRAKLWVDKGGRGGLRYLRDLASKYERAPRKP